MVFAQNGRGSLERLAQALGYFSIGLGLTEFAAARHVANSIGLSDVRLGLMRAMGVRAVVNGLAILAAPPGTLMDMVARCGRCD